MNAQRLYTPQLLGAALELAQWPPLDGAPLHGTARSPACGSSMAMDLRLDDRGRVEAIGLRVRACAVGQAAAAVFVRHARGLGAPEIASTHDRLLAWLEHDAAAPEWPDLGLIAPAREYRARHGAMLLPWKAALAALSSVAAGR